MSAAGQRILRGLREALAFARGEDTSSVVAHVPAPTGLLYRVTIEPLPPEDGGGFVAIVPDLPGCMSDGETPEDALANVRDAIATWIEAAQDMGRTIPHPSRHLVTALDRIATVSMY